MRLQPTLLSGLLAGLLSACGGSLEGETTATTTPSTTTTTTTTTSGAVSTAPVVDVATGKASYFTYAGASPEWITIKGTGAVNTQENSTVTFKLVDANGAAIVGEPVTFTLLIKPAGTILDPDTVTAVSDDSGMVSTLIKSGEVAGPVSIKVVSDNNPDISKTSNGLSVSTGYPDQDSFSISIDNFSPEGLDYDGVEVGVTIRLGGGEDNTAIPDGTVVNFRTNAGKITDETGTLSYCKTAGSLCKVKWTSQRPHSDNGRATITAYSIGEESFTDLNRDGLYSEGEAFIDNPEAFSDYNNNGVQDGTEWYSDKNVDQSYSLGDAKYTGMQCPENADYCNRDLVNIFSNAEIVMSGSFQTCKFTDLSGAELSTVDLTTATGSESVKVNVSVFDDNKNVPPSGSTISSDIGNGTLAGKSAWTIKNSVAHSFDFIAEFTREAELNERTSGTATFTITTPKGNETPCSLTVIDDPKA